MRTRYFRNYLTFGNDENAEAITVPQAIEYHCWTSWLLYSKCETKCPGKLSFSCIASSIRHKNSPQTIKFFILQMNLWESLIYCFIYTSAVVYISRVTSRELHFNVIKPYFFLDVIASFYRIIFKRPKCFSRLDVFIV